VQRLGENQHGRLEHPARRRRSQVQHRARDATAGLARTIRRGDEGMAPLDGQGDDLRRGRIDHNRRVISDDARRELLTAAEVAALFGVDPTAIARWTHDGRLPFVVTPSRHYRLRAADVD
jgi:excisionase family DNA binding protein